MCVCVAACSPPQFLVMADTGFLNLASGCSLWQGIGIAVLLLGPVALLFCSIWCVTRHIRSGEMEFADATWPSSKGDLKRVSQARGCFGRLKEAHAYYNEYRVRGEWTSDNRHTRCLHCSSAV